MNENPRELLDLAAKRRLAGATAEQQEQREKVDARNKALQEGAVKRGPNAPQSGIFGAVRKA